MFSVVAFVLLLTISLVALFWFITRSASERILMQFRLIAERIGVAMTEPPVQLGGLIRPEPFLHGTYRDCELSLSVPGKGLQNTRQIETVLKVKVPDTKTDLQMTLTSAMSRLTQRDAGKKKLWQSGDAAFDAAMTVRTSNPEGLAHVLDTDAREAFFKLLEGSKGTIYMGGGTLAFAEFGLIANNAKRERYEQAVEIFCDFAESLVSR